MKKLSKKEWVALSIGVVFVSYMFFGGDIMRIFNKSIMNEDNSASVATSNNQGVVINDITLGNGDAAVSGKVLSVHYILSLADGTVLQSSKDFGQPFKFVLGAGQVIKGWDVGLLGMKVGGTRTLTIPPEMAYGANGAGPIPPNSTLVFTVELLGVEDVSVAQ